MPEIYTSPGGNTPQAQSTQRFYEVLRQIQGMSPSGMSSEDLETGQAQAQSAALGLQANQGSNVANTSAQLTQQSGIPGLTSQYGDLSKAFEMFLADQGLSQKYSSGQNTNPYQNAGLMANANQGNGQIGGGATPNPYMASPEDIAASTQTEGFTNPDLVTRSMGAPLDATSNMLGLLQTALTGQRGQVDTKTKEYEQNYTGAMNALSNIAGVFGDERDRKAKAEGEGLDLTGLGGTPGSSSWGSFALVQGEENAKKYASEMEKAYGGEWAYQETPNGWEILKPITVTQDGTDTEPSPRVKMVNYETGDEIEVEDDEAALWALKGYEEY